MELANVYNKSSLVNPEQVQFIPFNNNEEKCYYCKGSYSTTLLFKQKYCKHCLGFYIKNTINNNLDVCITRIPYFRFHRLLCKLDFCTQNIHGWCNDCSEILYFKQIIPINKFDKFNYLVNFLFSIGVKIDCKLCGKPIYQQIPTRIIEFKLCVDCYQISSGWVESTLTKKFIPILYLPWWDTHYQCLACEQILEFKSNCQKLCLNYQSQCKKCKRIIFISVNNMVNIEEESVVTTKFITYSYNQITNYMNNIDKISDPLDVYNLISRLFLSKILMNLISYFKITPIEDNENSFKLTIPIIFIPFNNIKNECCWCKSLYCETLLFNQKYCGYCLGLYIKYTTSNNLDVYITTQHSNCSKHESRKKDYYIQDIQKWCNNCYEILFFNQIIPIDKFNKFDYLQKGIIIGDKMNCKLCGKPICQKISSHKIEFKLCIDCYQISSGWVESTLTKKFIPNLYLPWWDTHYQCLACEQILEFKSNCQKLCLNYQSQCKKCKRIIFISVNNMVNIEESVVATKFITYSYNQITNYMNNVNKISNPLYVYDFINGLYLPSKILMDLISYFKIPITADNENSFKLIMPIIFIPFNNNEYECCWCKRLYCKTLLFEQKYCRYCLELYIKYTTSNNLDIYITKQHSKCSKHESRKKDYYIQDIQEWCNNCSEILFLKQIIPINQFDYLQKGIIIGKKINCKLCGKPIYQQISSHKIEFKLCIDCYQISSGWVESTLTKKFIPILYLPWWDAHNRCIACDQILEFKSNCQKLCLSYQSQCKKCKRIIFITVNMVNIEEEDVVVTKLITYSYNQISNYMNNVVDKNLNPLYVYDFINGLYLPSKLLIELVSYLKFTIIEDNENSFNPIIPIMFIPFNNNENECYCCKRPYSTTFLFEQKYCKYCLMLYIKYTANDNLDIYISKRYYYQSQCNSGHEQRSIDFCTKNIQEWCNDCCEITYFKQIVSNNRFDSMNHYNNYEKQKFIENINSCKLCRKLIFQQQNFLTNIEFKLCSNCYKISSGWVESFLMKKSIPILYLPWWDTYYQCIICNQFLEFKSNCQKWCPNCIIIYIGCRYCLTTNIIFGITDQSRCKKCKRIEEISYIATDAKDNIDTCSDINDVLRYIQNALVLDSFNCKIANYMENVNTNPLDVYDYIRKIFSNSRTNQLSINEIPHAQITNFEYIAEGGFGAIYRAIWLGQNVAVKKFLNSQNISKYFLNEVKSLFQCYSLEYIVEVYGISQDIKTKEYMLIMKYASGGNLHNHLQKNFNDIIWNKKLHNLWKISEGLNVIHKKHFIHRDFHSGNILLAHQTWLICDLGLSLPANYSSSNNNEIYGVIPYIAPEIFTGGAFSKESDIYSIGMIMWELTTGCKPFADIEHDTNLIYKIIDGKRPEITKDTPECFANLMKRCWDLDPSKRPLITEITESLNNWYHKNKYADPFKQAESKRIELIQLKQLGPEFSGKPHPGAIFTSRPLSSLISNLSSMRSFDIKQDNKLIKRNGEYITKEQELDIEMSKSKKRNISEVTQIKTQDHEKHIRTDDIKIYELD
ncbi:kinase-like domain-containing protein [Rhizophagus clarus]|uniref:Kinase-like domain-containing protein n=1 Tax=Rhizophagus clarus TaxID=94130 RepID=A0A8H3LTM2_9GLOM|nr:kinase-like domain-containing protein [Rhizophagus clarus]